LSNIFKSRIVSVENEKYSMVSGETVSVPLRPVIMADSPLVSSAVSLSAAGETARRIIDEARSQADEIISQARIKAESMAQSAYQEGKQHAEKEKDRIVEKANAVLGQAHDMLEETVREREALVARYEDEILDLAVHIARKIIAENIEWDKAALTRIFKKAVDKIKVENEEIRVRLSLFNLDAIIPDDLGVEVVPDRTLERDECIVETENGEVNISISSQIAQIGSELRHLMV